MNTILTLLYIIPFSICIIIATKSFFIKHRLYLCIISLIVAFLPLFNLIFLIMVILTVLHKKYHKKQNIC